MIERDSLRFSETPEPESSEMLSAEKLPPAVIVTESLLSIVALTTLKSLVASISTVVLLLITTPVSARFDA